MNLNIAHLALAHAGVTAALAGLVWTVQAAVYPQFAAVGREQFKNYHRRYTRGITLVVAPLMMAEAITAAALLLQGVRGPLFLGSLVLLATIWAISLLVEMPLHRKLATGFDPVAHRNLVWMNWARTLAWTARTVMVGAWMFGLSAW
ncbi:MAG: hypothetical protein Q8J74_10040 [Candidatus Didemnitutus sp.]|nr:hypothetical protein [Candidatus Didemnitutus sp.]